MPLTPLHYSIAYLTYRISKKRLNLPVLIVSSMIPDLEIPIIWVITSGGMDRLVLHSFLGALIIGVPLTMFIFYPLYVYFFNRVYGIKKALFNEMCSLPVNLFSAVIGVLSHILIDATHHPFNPLFWPFVLQSFNGFILFGNLVLSSNLIYFIFLTCLLIITVKSILNNKNFIIQMFIF
ncbi:MAG: DUF4184 family protein [Promethearchaeota archaeon]